MTRRDLLKLLLASAVAESVDVEALLWTPKPIITVPGPAEAFPFGDLGPEWAEIRPFYDRDLLNRLLPRLVFPNYPLFPSRSVIFCGGSDPK